MTTRGSTPVVLLVVPPGTVRPEPLAAAIREVHPTWSIAAVWAGDPHLRPVLDDLIRWVDPPNGSIDVLVSQSEERSDWWFAASTAAALLGGGAPGVIVVRVGSVAVLGPLDDLLARILDPSIASPAVLLELASVPFADDGRWPDDEHLLRSGSLCTSFAAFGPGGSGALAWLAAQLSSESAGDIAVGRLLEHAASAFGMVRVDAPVALVSAARWVSDDPSIVDLTGFDAATPWTLLPTCAVPLRVEVATASPRRRTLERSVPQVEGARQPLRVPGGWLVDDTVRAAARRVSARGPLPDPWSEPGAFRDAMADAFWGELHAGRADLRAAFPQPSGANAAAFDVWCRRAAVDDGVAFVVPPVVASTEAHPERWSRRGRRTDGVDLIGYHLHESSLGDVARRISSSLGLAGVAHANLANRRTGSPLVATAPATANDLGFAGALAVVNADQFPALAEDHPELFDPATHLIGYWFWELEHVPQQMRDAAAMVDEIWVGSRFVADAFRAAVDTPVRHVPIPVPRPEASDRERSSFAPLASLGGLQDRFVFAVVFDHFSVTERKNPVGVIEAFRRAFAPDEGPVLVVKSMNASKRWPQHQQVVAAAGDRPRHRAVGRAPRPRRQHGIHRRRRCVGVVAPQRGPRAPPGRGDVVGHAGDRPPGTRATSTSWTTTVRC